MDIEKRKKELTPEENHVLFEGGTEAPFSGELLNEHREGQFLCKVCGTPLFASDTKFESGSGWPSFDQALPGAVEYVEDHSLGMLRTEVRCATCHAHLGHMFDDGPAATTGKRYCMNSVCLSFEEGKDRLS
jgi:peptide-methionine (R)-S-oxide reductase